MSIKSRLNIIVFLSILTIVGLYIYIVKITLDIDQEMIQIEMIESFENNISQLGLITEYYLIHQEERYITAWINLINNVEELSGQVDVFNRYHIVAESIPSIYGAFTLIVEIHNEPHLYPDAELRAELLERASTRIRSDVRQLMQISKKISEEHFGNIRELQVNQRFDFLVVLIPAILLIILLAYLMRRQIISSLNKLTSGTKAFSEGRLDVRIDIDEDDELGLLARQFNEMAEKLQIQLRRERELSAELEVQARELEDINRELEQFAYTASHDLKEPLRMVRNFMQMLKKNYNDQLDDRAQQYIHFAVDGAERMASLIDALLDYSRVGRMYDEFEITDTNQMINEIAEIFTSDAQNQGAEIIYSGLPEVRAVPLSLKMVFQNLVSNALKYRNPDTKPVITISCSETDTHWQFSISDNGIGIEEQFQVEIFTLFKRLHTSDQFKGTGMGLAICKKIVEQHGGKIWVESELGKGSTFYFTIQK